MHSKGTVIAIESTVRNYKMSSFDFVLERLFSGSEMPGRIAVTLDRRVCWKLDQSCVVCYLLL